jgi:septum formation protein
MSHLLAEKFKDFQIILASGSPRRKELLKGLDLDYTIETKEVDEVYPDHLKEQEITEYLARLKADAFGNIDEHTLIITADTIVWHQNQAVMKPVDDADAVAILKKLSGDMHLVYTSVCLRTQQFEKVFSETTEVYFDPLTDDEIRYYIDTYKPFDKAGAYGAQDWIGYVAVNRIVGSYFNVMGLPVHRLYKELKSLPI